MISLIPQERWEAVGGERSVGGAFVSGIVNGFEVYTRYRPNISGSVRKGIRRSG
jgi:hypothetical protein